MIISYQVYGQCDILTIGSRHSVFGEMVIFRILDRPCTRDGIDQRRHGSRMFYMYVAYDGLTLVSPE